jgi:beta-N-acetylhexosaminidase
MHSLPAPSSATFLPAVVVLSLLSTSCGTPRSEVSPPEPAQGPTVAVPEAPVIDEGDRIPVEWLEELPTPGAERPWLPESRLGSDEWAERVLDRLTLREKVGQMIMPWMLGDFAPEGSASFDRILRMVEEDEIGGIIASVGMPVELAAKLNVLQRRSRLPLLVAADLETGAGMRLRGAVFLPGGTDLGGATQFPPLMAVGATGNRYWAYEMGRITAREARAVGIHVPFAPVLDVNNNPDNPIINTRSFGEDPRMVGAMGACFVRGVQEYGAVATGKHFPGHGDTDVDSHLELPVIPVGTDRMWELELVPFQRAIQAGMGAVMTAHISLPQLLGGNRLPATLSPGILTGLLRGEMGFDGLIFTDAMDMFAIDRIFPREEAAVRAVEAGADVILMPPVPSVAIRGIMNAVLEGRVSEERIDESVRRILRQKAELGLHRERTVDLEAIHRQVGIPAHLEVAREIAEGSITLLRNERNLLPLRGTPTANVLSVTYRRRNDLLAGRFLNAGLRATYRRLQTVEVGQDTRQEEYDRLLERARRMDAVVVSLHIAAVSYDGSVAAPDELVNFIRGLSASGTPHVVVSFGNPYLLSEFPEVQSYLLAWGGSHVSQRAAAAALLGQIPIRGGMPTRIPPAFQIGDGLRLPSPPPTVVADLLGDDGENDYDPWAGDCG